MQARNATDPMLWHEKLEGERDKNLTALHFQQQQQWSWWFMPEEMLLFALVERPLSSSIDCTLTVLEAGVHSSTSLIPAEELQNGGALEKSSSEAAFFCKFPGVIS